MQNGKATCDSPLNMRHRTLRQLSKFCKHIANTELQQCNRYCSYVQANYNLYRLMLRCDDMKWKGTDATRTNEKKNALLHH